MNRKSLFILIALLVSSSILAVGTAAGQSPEEGRPPEPAPGPESGTESPPVADVGENDQDGEQIGPLVTFAEDLIVQGSTCTGFDCVTGESFSFDTLRLKENNLRVHFDDTSASASFPANDWRITINDSTNGGASYFGIDDATGATSPFRIEAGAPSWSLFVADTGRVGVGTNIPVTDLHTVAGNTPTLRLEQDGTSGFTPQTWDVASNETNFFVRDVTNGSALPFRIFPSASSNSLVIDNDSNIGVGTNNPIAPLHVVRSDGSAQLFVDENSTTVDKRELVALENNGVVSFSLNNTDLGSKWEFAGTTGGNFQINALGNPARFVFKPDGEMIVKNSDGDQILRLSPTGNMTIDGALTQNSDLAAKQALIPVDPSDILAAVAGMEIWSWEYADTAGVRHLGPMAQDFYESFDLGSSPTGISTLDTSGVALAAIQALATQNEELAAQNEELAAQNADLESRVAALEAVIAQHFED